MPSPSFVAQVSSTCFLQCYSDAVHNMTHDELAAPWTKAFESRDVAAGGCPLVAV